MPRNGWFECDDCGHRIGGNDSHIVLTNGSVVCMAHYLPHLDAGHVRTVLSRSATSDLLRHLGQADQHLGGVRSRELDDLGVGRGLDHDHRRDRGDQR